MLRRFSSRPPLSGLNNGTAAAAGVFHRCRWASTKPTLSASRPAAATTTNGSAHMDRPLSEAEVLALLPETVKQGKLQWGWVDATEVKSTGSEPKQEVDAAASGASGGRVLVSKVAETASDRMDRFGMPRGYPQTVAPGYGRYFRITVASSMLGNFAMAIATQKLLLGFFNDSSPSMWMLKDLAPSLLAAFVANFIASYELRPKFWLVISAVLTQATVVVDLFIPTFVPPEYYLPAAIFSSTIKQSSFLMYFVSRASVIQHFATHQNLGEVTKKFNTFGMVGYTVATAAGIGFSTYVTWLPVQAAVVFGCGLTTIYAAYSATSHIAFRALNQLHAMLIARWFIRSDFTSVPKPDDLMKVLGHYGMMGGRFGGSVTSMDAIQDAREAALREKTAEAEEENEEDVATCTVDASECAEAKALLPFLDNFELLEEMIEINPILDTVSLSDKELATAISETGLAFNCTMGFWKVSKPTPAGQAAQKVFPKAWNPLADKKVEKEKLVIFVQKNATVNEVLEATLVACSAVATHGSNGNSIKRFLHNSSQNAPMWRERAQTLVDLLGDANWDIATTHTIDTVDQRVSFPSKARQARVVHRKVDDLKQAVAESVEEAQEVQGAEKTDEDVNEEKEKKAESSPSQAA